MKRRRKSFNFIILINTKIRFSEDFFLYWAKCLVDHFRFDQNLLKFHHSAFVDGPHVGLQIIAVDTKKISFFIKKSPFNLTLCMFMLMLMDLPNSHLY